MSKPAHVLQPCIVTVPPDTHIPVDIHEIRKALSKRVDASNLEVFDQVADMVEHVCSHQFGKFRRAFKSRLLPFTAGAQAVVLPTPVGSEAPPEEELTRQEGQVLQDLLTLMAAARFHLLTDTEWQTAMLENFQFSLPVEVNFSVFDTQMLTRFWGATEELKKLRRLLPEMADCILVFHRGVDVAEASGLFVNEKINLLVSRLILQPVRKAIVALVAYVAALIAKQRGQAPAPSSVAAVSLTGASSTSAAAVSAPGASGPAMDRAASAPHRNQQTVERRTLERLLPTSWAVLTHLFKTIHLQEPMFKNMVIVYRTVQPTEPAQAPAPTSENPLTPDNAVAVPKLSEVMSRHNLHIRSFHNVPMADAEIIFPDKRVYINPVSVLNLLVTVVMALITAMLTIWQAGSAVDIRIVLGALSVVLARCLQVHTALQGERSAIQQRMVQTQYNAADDCHEGVVSVLVEDMADQQVKEMLIAYALLLKRVTLSASSHASITGTLGMSASQLDKECEDWLEASFGLKADFSVENALSRLFEWGLVKHHPGSYEGATPSLASYVAVPLPEAYKILNDYWSAVPCQSCVVQQQMRALSVCELLVQGGSLPLVTPFQSRALLNELRPTKAKQYNLSSTVGSSGGSVTGISPRNIAAAFMESFSSDSGHISRAATTAVSDTMTSEEGTGALGSQRSGKEKSLVAKLGLKTLFSKRKGE